jgi:hypothetical protein
MILFLVLLASCTMEAKARTSMRRAAPKDADLKALQVKQASSGNANVSPEVDGSSKDFFKKDFPWDKRPKADPFHFKHPYPVVQDSGDYDKDFVKDENSDNGSWKAQETYDRLRVKLAKEKKDLAKALAKKSEEEKELHDTMQRHEAEQRAAAEAARKAEAARRAEKEHIQPKEEEDVADVIEKTTGVKVPRVGPKPKEPKGEVDVSTEETENAMANLEDCKKELAKARQDLKDLMKELQEAKAKQHAANTALDEAMNRELMDKEQQQGLKKQAKNEYQEYKDAKEAYDEQKALVEKLDSQIKIAASKVKAIRDAEDPNGGVYNSPDGAKSGASAAHFMWALGLAVAAAWAA